MKYTRSTFISLILLHITIIAAITLVPCNDDTPRHIFIGQLVWPTKLSRLQSMFPITHHNQHDNLTMPSLDTNHQPLKISLPTFTPPLTVTLLPSHRNTLLKQQNITTHFIFFKINPISSNSSPIINTIPIDHNIPTYITCFDKNTTNSLDLHQLLLRLNAYLLPAFQISSIYPNRPIHAALHTIHPISPLESTPFSFKSSHPFPPLSALQALPHATGNGINIGIFDTGHLSPVNGQNNIIEITDWTGEDTGLDGVGHGSAVASLLSSADPYHNGCQCLLNSPNIYIFKVFNSRQKTQTINFIDAFEYATTLGLDIINLSLGGPDLSDIPYLTAFFNLVKTGSTVLIAAVGNDGPQYGSLSSPADCNEVIGVGSATIPTNSISLAKKDIDNINDLSTYNIYDTDIITPPIGADTSWFNQTTFTLVKSYNSPQISSLSCSSQPDSLICRLSPTYSITSNITVSTPHWYSSLLSQPPQKSLTINPTTHTYDYITAPTIFHKHLRSHFHAHGLTNTGISQADSNTMKNAYVSPFSSRGPTSRYSLNIPSHFVSVGRVKPDIIVPGDRINVFATTDPSNIPNQVIGCTPISGTSIASPLMTGIIAMGMSYLQHQILDKYNIETNYDAFLKNQQKSLPPRLFIPLSNIIKPSMWKSIVMNSGIPLTETSATQMDYGAGLLSIPLFISHLDEIINDPRFEEITSGDFLKYKQIENNFKHTQFPPIHRKITTFPDTISSFDCAVNWPYCTQPIFPSQVPTTYMLSLLTPFHYIFYHSASFQLNGLEYYEKHRKYVSESEFIRKLLHLLSITTTINTSTIMQHPFPNTRKNAHINSMMGSYFSDLIVSLQIDDDFNEIIKYPMIFHGELQINAFTIENGHTLPHDGIPCNFVKFSTKKNENVSNSPPNDDHTSYIPTNVKQSNLYVNSHLSSSKTNLSPVNTTIADECTNEYSAQIHIIVIPLHLMIIPQPKRQYRVLFDMYHTLSYPFGYSPSDFNNANIKGIELYGDSLYTNYKDMYAILRRFGYYIDALTTPLHATDSLNPLIPKKSNDIIKNAKNYMPLSKYSSFLCVDLEVSFDSEELDIIKNYIEHNHGGLILFPEWDNLDSLEHHLRFYDLNTNRVWLPHTAGSATFVLNQWLSQYGIQLSSSVYNGRVYMEMPKVIRAPTTSMNIGKITANQDKQDKSGNIRTSQLQSTASIAKAPDGAYIVQLSSEMSENTPVPIYHAQFLFWWAHSEYFKTYNKLTNKKTPISSEMNQKSREKEMAAFIKDMKHHSIRGYENAEHRHNLLFSPIFHLTTEPVVLMYYNLQNDNRFTKSNEKSYKPGSIAIFTDTSCIDGVSMQYQGCLHLIPNMIQYVSANYLQSLKSTQSDVIVNTHEELYSSSVKNRVYIPKNALKVNNTISKHFDSEPIYGDNDEDLNQQLAIFDILEFDEYFITFFMHYMRFEQNVWQNIEFNNHDIEYDHYSENTDVTSTVPFVFNFFRSNCLPFTSVRLQDDINHIIQKNIDKFFTKTTTNTSSCYIDTNTHHFHHKNNHNSVSVYDLLNHHLYPPMKKNENIQGNVQSTKDECNFSNIYLDILHEIRHHIKYSHHLYEKEVCLLSHLQGSHNNLTNSVPAQFTALKHRIIIIPCKNIHNDITLIAISIEMYKTLFLSQTANLSCQCCSDAYSHITTDTHDNTSFRVDDGENDDKQQSKCIDCALYNFVDYSPIHIDESSLNSIISLN